MNNQKTTGDISAEILALTDGLAPCRESQPLRPLVERAISLVLDGSQARCELDLPRDLWDICCDQGEIQRVVVNLVTNAYEAMGQAGTIETSARNQELPADSIDSLKEGKYIELSIRDHGTGIQEEHLQKIFDPYFSTKERGAQKGMGLGLTTTHSIVKRHRGHISLKSKVGVGTTIVC